MGKRARVGTRATPASGCVASSGQAGRRLWSQPQGGIFHGRPQVMLPSVSHASLPRAVPAASPSPSYRSPRPVRPSSPLPPQSRGASRSRETTRRVPRAGPDPLPTACPHHQPAPHPGSLQLHCVCVCGGGHEIHLLRSTNSQMDAPPPSQAFANLETPSPE